MKHSPKAIIISGTARNVGKTTFACQLIQKYKKEEVIAIKITPHFHSLNSDSYVIEENDKFVVVKELSIDNNKDSSLMLKAGAKEVYFVMTKDENLQQLVDYLSSIIDFRKRIIIESAAIRRHIQPQTFYLIYNDEMQNSKSNNLDLEEFVDFRVNSKDIFK